MYRGVGFGCLTFPKWTRYELYLHDQIQTSARNPVADWIIRGFEERLPRCHAASLPQLER